MTPSDPQMTPTDPKGPQITKNDPKMIEKWDPNAPEIDRKSIKTRC